MKRRTPILATVLAAILAMTLIGPAHAVVAPPVVSDLDSSTPGHVTGTITSPGAPYIRIRLIQNYATVPTQLTLSGDSGTFDLPTWGYSGTTRVYATACTTPELTTCSDEIPSTATFVPVDIAPQVTWSADTSIGPGESPSVTVDDAGGGVLTASFYSTADGLLTTTPSVSVAKHGTTTLDFPFPDGSRDIHLLRCDAANTTKCAELSPPQIRHYDIHTALKLSWVPLTPISTTRPATTLQIDTDRKGTYDLNWHLEVAGQALAEPTGSLVGQPLDGNGALAPIVIDGTSLTDEAATYVVVAELAVHDPDFGTYSRSVNGGLGRPTFGLDRTPPVTSLVFRHPSQSNVITTTIYPNVNMSDRPGSARIWTNDQDFDGVVIKNSTGTVVRRLPGTSYLTWNGRNAGGVVVPSGTYDLAAYDAALNESTAVGHLKVDARRRVIRTWTRTVKAAPSLVDTYVGRCSTLRRPSARGWVGSLGFYANTRCSRQTWRASAVSTMHGIYLPPADRYLAVTVDVYGGAAKTRPKSWAGIRLLDGKGEWHSWTGLKPYLGRHHGFTTNGTYTPGLVYPDRSFYWGMATVAGDRYDVARFIVTVRYYALV